MRPDRHVVMGAGGTVIASTGTVALIDAAPGSGVAAAWERELFDVEGAVLDDLLTALGADLPGSFAVAAATVDGTAIVVCGDASAAVEGDAAAIVNDTATHRWTHTTAGADDRITLTLTGDDTSTGQWLTIGVIAGATVVVGSLVAPGRGGRPVIQPVEPMPADDVDFGNLLRRRPAAATESPASASDERPTVLQPVTAGSGGDSAADRRADTAQFATLQSSTGRSGRVVLGDGRTFSLDSPIVIGRRPPTDPIEGQVPHAITIDDTLLSRHHVTLRLVDDQLVVIDEASTNGTTVTLPGASPARCSPRRPVIVPLGATIDIGGVITATYDVPPADDGAESC